MSLLTIVSDAMTQCGLTAPTLVYASTDATVKLFMNLAQVEGDALSRATAWRGLKTSGTITGDGTTTQFALPAAFHRFMTPYPFWLDNHPSSPLFKVGDAELLSFQVAETQPTRPVWRMKGEFIEFYPAPDSGEIIKYEYLSQYWISGRARWSADDNTCVIPERLISLGLVWRFKQAKGFDYAEDFRSYQIERNKEMMVEGGVQTIRARSHFLGDYGNTILVDPRVTV